VQRSVKGSDFQISKAELLEEMVTNKNRLLLLSFGFFFTWYFLQAKMSRMMKTFALESPLQAHSPNVRTAIKTNQRFTSLAMPSICCFVTSLALMKCN